MYMYMYNMNDNQPALGIAVLQKVKGQVNWYFVNKHTSEHGEGLASVWLLVIFGICELTRLSLPGKMTQNRKTWVTHTKRSIL